jgi:5-methylcytosine-specific restriction endonuclease McrA
MDKIPFEQLKKDRSRKARLEKERGRECEVCHKSTWMEKPIPIELDHIDGNPENNARENLRLICPNCHAQTDTYKGKNMGKHPWSKRKRALDKYNSTTYRKPD